MKITVVKELQMQKIVLCKQTPETDFDSRINFRQSLK